MLVQMTDSKKKELVNNLLEHIQKSDFTIIMTKKNKQFIMEFKLDKPKIIEKVLNKISVDTLYSYEFDKDTAKYGVGYVIIFIYDVELIDKYGDEQVVNVYVKFKETENNIPVLSVHRSKGDRKR